MYSPTQKKTKTATGLHRRKIKTLEENGRRTTDEGKGQGDVQGRGSSVIYIGG
jgi:hypothetical protein